jgi:hypothetical protein
MLAKVLHEQNNVEESERVYKEVEADLLTCGYTVDIKKVDQHYMEQFFLIYHR